MSILTVAIPAESALPALEVLISNALNVVRPMLGVGVLAAIVVAFKPLLVGLLRAALLVVKPRRSLEQREERRRLKAILQINRLARDVEGLHPSMASELRSIASRGN
ncbi:MAG TPA: hypothetical protein VJ698_19810 [Noviherbaspirillum sp.]|uniref:hypothetical protein n=1 Tax=Noviherbaspirillum sp. TaxID=1926288 RepID=UPI002B46E22C|nr:hypothetical protein [Noviherbaspirillum sp.]HJV87726.1 hypothetical protein [Noviherbaspirillum sp.]